MKWRSFEDSDLLLKGVSETIQSEAKEQKGGFLSMLLGTLDASLLGNILSDKGINRSGEGVIRAGYGNNKCQKKQHNGFLMPPHPLTNFEIQKYYQNKPRFNGVYSRDNLSRIKDGAYVIILMSTLILDLIGLLCMYKIMMLLILILSE